MIIIIIVFWLSAICVVYTFAIYPLLLTLLARWCSWAVRPKSPPPRSVSIIVAAHNEESSIVRRLEELTRLLEMGGYEGEVILVSDGSTDGTVPLARPFTKKRVHICELQTRLGKAAALNIGSALSEREILVFADIRQAWAPDALKLLLENFGDPRVGAVSGDLLLLDSTGTLAGVALYWRYEKILRRLESQVNSAVGVTGAISAVRRSLFQPLPSGTVLDDVYWPLQVVLQGYRVIHDRRAIAYDRLPTKTRDEFRRKVRTLSGNYQLISRLPEALFPWRNPIWLQFVSHKVLRLIVPWALLAILVSNAFLSNPLYRIAYDMQITMYGLGILGLIPFIGKRSRIASTVSSFLVLNSAAWLAFWVWICGKSEQSWNKTSYREFSLVGTSTLSDRSQSVLPNNRETELPLSESPPYETTETVAR